MEPVSAQTLPSCTPYEGVLKRVAESLGNIEQKKEVYIKGLYWREFYLSRLALFTHHVRMASIEIGRRNLTREYQDVQPDLLRYANAVKRYKRVLEYSNLQFEHYLEAMQEIIDTHLLDIACQTVALEQWRQERGGDPATDDPLELQEAKLDELQQAVVSSKMQDLCQEWAMMHATKSANISSYESIAMETHQERLKLLWKLTAAVFGGLTLIVPMLIMVLHPSLLTVTTTTSVFVLVISVLLVFVMKGSEPKDVVTATVAYAAVLVVFVGASGSCGGTGSTSNASRNSTSTNSMSSGKIGGIVAGSIVGTFLLMIAILASWLLNASRLPGVPIPIPGVENPRRNEEGEVMSLYDISKAKEAERRKRMVRFKVEV